MAPIIAEAIPFRITRENLDDDERLISEFQEMSQKGIPIDIINCISYESYEDYVKTAKILGRIHVLALNIKKYRLNLIVATSKTQDFDAISCMSYKWNRFWEDPIIIFPDSIKSAQPISGLIHFFKDRFTDRASTLVQEIPLGFKLYLYQDTYEEIQDDFSYCNYVHNPENSSVEIAGASIYTAQIVPC